MERRDSGLLVGALGLALSFRPSLMRRGRRDQVLVSASALAFGAIAGTWTEALVVQLARRMGDREGAARGIVIGAGAVAILGQLPASRHSAVAFTGSVARVTGNIVRGTAKLRVFQRHREDGRLVYGCMKGTTRSGGETMRVQWPPGCGS